MGGRASGCTVDKIVTSIALASFFIAVYLLYLAVGYVENRMVVASFVAFIAGITLLSAALYLLGLVYSARSDGRETQA